MRVLISAFFYRRCQPPGKLIASLSVAFLISDRLLSVIETDSNALLVIDTTNCYHSYACRQGILLCEVFHLVFPSKPEGKFYYINQWDEQLFQITPAHQIQSTTKTRLVRVLLFLCSWKHTAE